MTAPRLSVTSARNRPFNCVLSLKAGSTFLRNLIYILDQGAPFEGNEKAFPTSLLNRELTREELAGEVSFYIVRDPVERFFSLYFDKVIGKPENRFVWITDKLKTHRVFHDGPELTLAQHRENAMSLLGFLGVRLRGQIKGPINPHWNKQITRLQPAIMFQLQPLMLEQLEPQLLTIAKGRIDGLEAAIDMVQSRNRSPRPVAVADILTPEIYHKIASLYPEDLQLYDLVKTGWSLLGQPPKIEL